MCAYQGLRPWLRSLALRAKTEVGFYCLPGTASLATLVRPPGGNRSCSMCAYQGLRPWLRSLALRAKTELVFIVYQGLAPGNTR
jgi:hypothetical protein